MESRREKKISEKEDADSGLENTSDSGNSYDDEPLAIPSDYEDILNSDNEGNYFENEDTSNVNRKLSFGDKINDTVITNETYHINSPINSNTVHGKDKESENKDFDVRIELQSNLIDEEYKDVVEFYKTLTKGQSETVDFSVFSSAEKPKWLDEEKFKRGQLFARTHLFCINFAEMLSLFILFAQKASLGPLIFTGKSDSPFTSFKRYLNTLTKLMSWYQDDVWTEPDSAGNKNLNLVRGMHKNVYQKLTNSSAEELAEKTTLGDPTTTALWCPLQKLLKDDFKETVLPPNEEVEKLLSARKVWVNQADMSMTQFGFVGLAVTYPEYFGIYLATDEDLDAFLHLWRGLGYLLGIKDEYNYCNSDLETVRKRTKFFIEAVAKPAFREVTCDWEHMCRCLTAGISFYLPQVNFESAFLYLCHMLEIPTPRLRKQITFRTYFIFLMHRLVFYLMKFSGVLDWLNSRLYEIVKKAQNAPPEILNKWQTKEFSYMKQEGKCPIRGQLSSNN